MCRLPAFCDGFKFPEPESLIMDGSSWLQLHGE